MRGIGLIPARAGNTGPRRTFLLALRAHPRSRGEHYGLYTTGAVDEGSSPLARGTQRVHSGNQRIPGLIPARAGNTRGFQP